MVFNEVLPTYQDAIREDNRSQSSYWFSTCFLCVNVIITIITPVAYVFLRLTDMLPARINNVTVYCNDAEYHKPIPTWSYFDVKLAGILFFTVPYILLLCSAKTAKYTKRQFFKRLGYLTWILATNLIFLAVFIEFIKCVVGAPYPYFFSNENITKFYCGNTENEYLPKALRELDNNLRKSFPSLGSAISAFCTTALYFYLTHFDIKIGLRGSQQMVLLLMGGWLTYCQVDSWNYGEQHANDILAGAAIGIIQGMSMVCSMFGSLYYSRKSFLVIRRKGIYNYRPFAPPMETDDSEIMQDFYSRNYESAETIFVDDLNETGLNTVGCMNLNNIVPPESSYQSDDGIQESLI